MRQKTQVTDTAVDDEILGVARAGKGVDKTLQQGVDRALGMELGINKSKDGNLGLLEAVSAALCGPHLGRPATTPDTPARSWTGPPSHAARHNSGSFAA